mmetsp:Transcript_38881/g.89043  ORF Transcript_38881/g.89043 Transcript_38881/m.89043 type:complete len:204 (-) Transcript_38881:35-646(-)
MALATWVQQFTMRCCCMEGGDSSTEIVTSAEDPRMKEGDVRGLVQQVSLSSGLPGQDQSVSAEDRQREKDKFYRLVREFAKVTTKAPGEPCQVLDLTGQVHEANFSIDKSLNFFTVRGTQGASGFELSKLSEVFRDPGDAGHPDLADRVRELKAKDQFVGVAYTGAEGPASMCLILRSSYERERFFVCMKILRWAMESPSTEG